MPLNTRYPFASFDAALDLACTRVIMLSLWRESVNTISVCEEAEWSSTRSSTFSPFAKP